MVSRSAPKRVHSSPGNSVMISSMFWVAWIRVVTTCRFLKKPNRATTSLADTCLPLTTFILAFPAAPEPFIHESAILTTLGLPCGQSGPSLCKSSHRDPQTSLGAPSEFQNLAIAQGLGQQATAVGPDLGHDRFFNSRFEMA